MKNMEKIIRIRIDINKRHEEGVQDYVFNPCGSIKDFL